ncbi:MAG: phosphohistidine phosphatase SixA [Acidobacteria bacterium]|nr:phosphohistidine phosphatase SixA [Acidobacteriota bacterium]
MVVLVHHGPAVGPDVDPTRPLSAEGLDDVKVLADAMADKGLKPHAIWHSGKLRARQTAEAVWLACNPLGAFGAERGLQPADPPEWLRDRLAGETRDIVVVGHMPHLPALLALLTGVSGAGAHFPVHGCVALADDGGRWVEAWRVVHPERAERPGR